MLHRRDFLAHTLRGSSLLALGTVVPQFLADTAKAAGPAGAGGAGKDNVLVVIEMTGGNDGLNTVIPYADDLYHKARPTLRFTKEQVVRVDDHVGLHPAMRPLERMLKDGQVAVVQGVGYPNPDRSHFESMDIWQSGEPGPKVGAAGWLARSVPDLQKGAGGGVPVMHIGSEKLPLACRGTTQGIFTINQQQPFELKLSTVPGSAQEKARKKLIEDLAQGSL